jgi:hypothetical protein
MLDRMAFPEINVFITGHFGSDCFIMTGIEEGDDIWSDKRGNDIYLTGGDLS